MVSLINPQLLRYTTHPVLWEGKSTNAGGNADWDLELLPLNYGTALDNTPKRLPATHCAADGRTCRHDVSNPTIWPSNKGKKFTQKVPDT